jgi:hypothetical protein
LKKKFKSTVTDFARSLSINDNNAFCIVGFVLWFPLSPKACPRIFIQKQKKIILEAWLLANPEKIKLQNTEHYQKNAEALNVPERACKEQPREDQG